MNLLTIRNRARRKANVQNTTVIVNSSIVEDINVAQDILTERIVQVNEDFFEEQKSKFDLVADQDLYALPDDLIKFKQLRVAYSTPSNEEDYKIAIGYNPSSVEQINTDEESIATNNPIVDITNNFVRIKPTPSTNVTHGGEVYYIARLSALVNTGDVSVIPHNYHDLMSIYAAQKICEEFEMWTKADRLERQFEIGLEKMARALAGRQLNFPEQFKNFLATNARINKTTQELY